MTLPLHHASSKKQYTFLSTKKPKLLATTVFLICVLLQFVAEWIMITPSVTANERHLQKDLAVLQEEPQVADNTGKLFSGSRIRIFDPQQRRLQDENPPIASSATFPLSGPICDKWGVVTTINPPTEAVQAFARLPDWCLAIVADTKTPQDYKTVLLQESGMDATAQDRIVFLSVQEQKEGLKGVPFVQRLPWRSFARKNIGFLFAIRHGAKVLFDFDDDNVLKEDVLYQLESLPQHDNIPTESRQSLKRQTLFVSPHYPPENHQVRDAWTVRVPHPNISSGVSHLAFNPLAHMGASAAEIWPRGFPLEAVRSSMQNDQQNATQITYATLPLEKVAVVQAVCDLDPDVDAIFRLTRELPVHFDDGPATASRLLIPPGKYTPYNAQATLHMNNAFWGLLLPYTVPGRVTDIWRSYFTERILQDLQLAVLYSPPVVVHNRSAHNYIADMRAEDDLYMKTSKLLEFLSTWKDESSHLPARLENLCIALYEHDYIGLEDVYAMQEWLLALISVGYKFPSLTEVPQPLSSSLKPVGVLRDQPYSIPPRYNVGGPNGNLTFGEYINSTGATVGTLELWQAWLESVKKHQSLNPELVPNKIRLVSLIMAKDEWPLIKNNILYNGQLLGFENLYIFDASTDPRSLAFLRFARDHLGANVIFTPADLSQVTNEMTMVGRMLVGSSDLIAKTDADEFWGLNTKNTTCQFTSDDAEMKDKVWDCSLSPQQLATFLENRTNLKFFEHMGRLEGGYQALSSPSREICHVGRGDEIGLFDFHSAGSSEYKSVVDTRTFDEVDLGGHHNFRHFPHQKGRTLVTPLGMFHIHSQCLEHELANARNVLVGHGYLNQDDSLSESLSKLKEITGENICQAQGIRQMKKRVASYHKVLFYTKSLVNCSIDTQDSLFGHWGQAKNLTKNPDFAHYLQAAVSNYFS